MQGSLPTLYLSQFSTKPHAVRWIMHISLGRFHHDMCAAEWEEHWIILPLTIFLTQKSIHLPVSPSVSCAFTARVYRFVRVPIAVRTHLRSPDSVKNCIHNGSYTLRSK